jgi:hypothetical protein
LVLSALLATPALAVKPALESIAPGEYRLVAVSNHTPGAYKNSQDYWKSLQRVELTIGNAGQFRDLPKLGMKNPYIGMLTLGDRPQRFGVIIDVVGEEKRLYIDRNGDGSFAGEAYTLLLNEWQGLQVYWVLGPEPLQVQVGYSFSKERAFPVYFDVFGILNKPGVIYKEPPYLMVAIRTWFLAKINESGFEKLVAVVDRNNNGRFNDPEDQLFIDYNDDGFFSDNEVLPRKKGITLKSGSQNLKLDWDVYPERLVIGGKS